LFLQALGSGHADRLHFFCAEAKQSGHIPHLVELGIFLHIEGLDIATNHPGEDGFADIHNFLRGPPADRAVADKVGVNMTAMDALDGLGLQILSDQERLRLAEFQGPQDPPESGHASPITAGMVQRLGYKFVAPVVLPFLKDLFRMALDLIARGMRHVGVETSNQRLS
jgi:hypothetical protein